MPSYSLPRTHELLGEQPGVITDWRTAPDDRLGRPNLGYPIRAHTAGNPAMAPAISGVAVSSGSVQNVQLRSL